MGFFITSRWRVPNVIIAFFVAEFAFTIPVLALFAIADPDLYRTRLWQDGYDNGFNSNPLEVLYAYANHRPIPEIPLLWSQSITSYNVVISVLSTFLLLVKAIMFILHIWYPLLSFLVHGILVGLWTYSAYGQASPDMSDPKQPQPGAPWYIAKSCSVAHYKSNIPYCQQAKSAFAITMILIILFSANTAWAIWSMIPTKAERLARQTEVEENDGDKRDSYQTSFELNELPKALEANGGMRAAMKSAMTPRTLAFNTLEGRSPGDA